MLAYLPNRNSQSCVDSGNTGLFEWLPNRFHTGFVNPVCFYALNFIDFCFNIPVLDICLPQVRHWGSFSVLIRISSGRGGLLSQLWSYPTLRAIWVTHPVKPAGIDTDGTMPGLAAGESCWRSFKRRGRLVSFLYCSQQNVKKKRLPVVVKNKIKTCYTQQGKENSILKSLQNMMALLLSSHLCQIHMIWMFVF